MPSDSIPPQGKINLEGGNALSEKMAEIKPQPHQLWVIDLADVDFMDSLVWFL